MNRLYLLTISAAFLLCSCHPGMPTDLNRQIEMIALDLVKEKEKAWNRGDLEAYMEGYWKSDSLRFVSGADIYYGWDAALQRYRQGYPDRKVMGHLTFSDMDVTVLSDNAAMLFGRWELKREHDNPWGLYTLLIKKTDQGWKIVHDHTSASE